MWRSILLAAALLFPIQGNAIEIRPDPANETIRINGDIDALSTIAFLKALDAAPWVKTVELDSLGGSVQSSLFISQMVRKKGLSTSIPEDAKCLSACAFIFFAGIDRDVAGALGVHQIYGANNDSTTQTDLSVVVEALTSYGVDPNVLTIMLRTPPQQMHVFSAEELQRFGIVRTSAGPEKAILYEEVAGSQQPRQVSGSVKWTAVSKGQGFISGVISVPGLSGFESVRFERNTDPTLPATHLLTFTFSPSSSVASIGRVMLKTAETERGTQLVGVAARLSETVHVFALNDFPEARKTNADLLKGRDWMDVTATYRDGTRIVLALQKSGDAAEEFDKLLGN